MNRSPAFQFYPDKWQSHTRRLSDSAYRVFHELLCWMWQSSPDHCSVSARVEAVSVAVALPLECVRIAMADIQNADAPLLKTEGDRWVCHGLRKEAEKQFNRRVKATENANARWNHATASKHDATASIPQCSSSSSPIPSSSPSPIPSSEAKEKIAVQGKPEQPTARKRTVKLATDEEWLAKIRETYKPLGVDVDREIIKANGWLMGPKGTGRSLTRQFFINWLGRADKDMGAGNRTPVLPLKPDHSKGF
jgi:uncharacterized protein YdaU (DUF1376 family)